MLKLLTYNEALDLVNLPNSPFYESKYSVDGYNISTFNYRLASWSDFNAPGAKEMRGLTFVFNADGSLFKRYLLLEKFFNLNQVPDTMYSEVKNLKIRSIANKEDGSIASFIKLPNGRVLGKSKMSVATDQAVGITRVYSRNESVKRLVDWSFDNDITAVFEYVAPSNRIVLRYDTEDLILLRLRNNLTGELLDLNDYLDVIGDVKIAPFENGYTLDELIELASYVENKEGWIVEFENGLLMKIKTAFYFRLHGLFTEDLNRENIIIDYILKDEIDDVLSKIPDDTDTIVRIDNIVEKVRYALDKKSKEIDNLYDKYLSINNRKEFAILYNKNENFGYVMSMLNGKNSYELAKDYLSKKTNKLLSAREWLSI